MEKIGRKALHRGLRALLSNGAAEETQGPGTAQPAQGGPLMEIHLKEINRNPYQPRIQFDREEMDGLKESMRQHGVIEPIIVRRSKGAFEIISGERRFKAALELGYETIPAVVRDKVSDREMRILALVENQQRTDLNDVEIAGAYHELIQAHNYTHEQLAQDTGKSRSFITNTLRLLKLPEHIKEAMLEKKISSGHARALLSVEDTAEQEKLFRKILSKGLSVRQIEELVGEKKAPKKGKDREKKSFDMIDLESFLSSSLGTKVKIKQSKNKGSIIISFLNVEDLNRIVSFIRKA